MVFKRTTMRYAHTNGHTFCTFTQDGSTIITCGSDGDMRTWQSIDDDDPSSKCLGEFIICIVHYDNRVLVSTDLNTVQAYNFPEMTRDGTEFRFTAPANCMAVNKNYIAAGSEDTDIKIVKKDKVENEINFQGHNGPILACDLSVNDILASVSGDGTLKVWDIKEEKEIKSFEGLPKVKSLDEVKCYGSPSFEPKYGSSLAYCKNKEVIILNTNTWDVQFTLTNENITSDYSCCKFSPDGQYLAAGTRNGEISIWNFMNKQNISGETTSSECQSITSLVWNPKNNGELAYCDSTGQLGTAIGCTENSTEQSNNEINSLNENSLDDGMNNFEFEDDVENVDDGDGISLEKLKNETMKANGLTVNGSVIGDDKDSDTKSMKNFEEHFCAKTFKQQESFQPGESPLEVDHRYLVWNSIGIVKSSSDDSESSIDVEFHDVATHHALHMNNYLNHNIASLSSTVLALSGYNANKLVCIALGGSGSREWSTDLPNCEGINAIAATDNLVAVATDNRMLRIFTVMGTQREVISLPGPVVAMCGRDNKLMVAYHSAPATEDQHISAMLIQTFGATLRTRDIRIPITPQKKLTWIGYSDRGSPVCNDTMGLVQMFSTKASCWYPVCDTMKHSQSVSNNFYIIEVLESTQQLQAVLCRASTYPMTSPRPMVVELPMQIPLCDIENEKSILEESIVRWSTFNVENSERMIKESALKLFALACHAELETRAKELIEMIGSTALLPMAVKYANKLGRIHLADKLTELMPQLEHQDKQKEKEMLENEANAFSVLQSCSLNSSILASLKQKNATTPSNTISPKPMVLHGIKRNPFKRLSTSTENHKSQITTNDNPLSHLTEKALGYDVKSKSSQVQDDSLQVETNDIEPSLDEIPPTENNENKAKNDGAPSNFMSWFTENREDLEKLHSGTTNTELTKIAMKEYKKITNTAVSKDGLGKFGKRKLTDDSEVKQSGVAKLAKFSFKK